MTDIPTEEYGEFESGRMQAMVEEVVGGLEKGALIKTMHLFPLSNFYPSGTSCIIPGIIERSRSISPQLLHLDLSPRRRPKAALFNLIGDEFVERPMKTAWAVVALSQTPPPAGLRK